MTYLRLINSKRQRVLWIRLLLTGTASLLTGCIDERLIPDASISSISPQPVVQGQFFVIEGEGFGRGGLVRIGDKACQIRRWNNHRIEAIAGPGIDVGPSQLAIDGRRPNIARSPIIIAQAPADMIVPKPGLMDSGSSRDNGSDSGILQTTDASAQPPQRDAVSPIDALQPHLLTADFSPDPSDNSGVRMTARTDIDGLIFLTLEFNSPDPIGGVAFHMVYDSAHLIFEVADKEIGPRFQAKEIAPGRLALGWVKSVNQAPRLELRFRLIGAGEGRIEIPARYRTVRDESNTPFAGIQWSTGSLRIRSRR